MKRTKKYLILAVFITIALLVIIPSTAQAALQSNGGAVATKKIDDWIVQIRKMEASGGTLGLSETINTTGLLATTASNGIDCHMEKNTEYGALAILSASAYGNPNVIASGGTTTGNATGVKMNINKEWVAAGAGLTGTSYAKKADSRYINNDYGIKKGGKYHIGDAMNIGNWHSSGSTGWCNTPDLSGILRAYSASIFSYYGQGNPNSSKPDANYSKSWASRAVVVIGTGL